MSYYIYSLPTNTTMFMDNPFPIKKTILPQLSESQVINKIKVLGSDSQKSSTSDQMLKNLLEKFEIIYNDSVIQNKNLGTQLSQMDESINGGHFVS